MTPSIYFQYLDYQTKLYQRWEWSRYTEDTKTNGARVPQIKR